jgi:DNA-binding CsgD family transcriptional regulator
MLAALLVVLSESARQAGYLEQAKQAADEAILDSELGNSLRLAQAIALKSAAQVWSEPTGVRSARLLAQQALAQQAPGQNTVDGSASVAVLALAQAVWLEGDSAYCVTLLLNEGGGAHLGNLPMAYRNAVWELLCAAGNDAGLPIEDWAAYSAEHAARFPTSRNVAYDDLTRGHLRRAQSSLAQARQGYQSAAKRFAAAKMPIERSYALGHAAHALSLLGLQDQAVAAAGTAVAIARQTRACTLEAWLQRQIVAPTHMPAQFGQLTDREREVAAMVCSGIRRRDIAARLSISIRTVDVHLTRIYRKTGVTSRMELAVALNRPTPLGQAMSAERRAS